MQPRRPKLQNWKNCLTNERVSSNLPSKNPITLSESEITARNYSSRMEDWAENWNLELGWAETTLVENRKWKIELKPESTLVKNGAWKVKMEECSVSWKKGVHFLPKWGKTKIENENE